MRIMVNQLIEKDISNYLQSFKKDYKQQGFDFEIYSEPGAVEVTGYYNDEYYPNKKTPFVLLRLVIMNECKQIQISNIFLPQFMRHKAIGKNIIKNIFTISKEQGYTLFIVDMVNSFYKRMIDRGALPFIGCDDAVQIVDTTNLSSQKFDFLNQIYEKGQ